MEVSDEVVEASAEPAEASAEPVEPSAAVVEGGTEEECVLAAVAAAVAAAVLAAVVADVAVTEGIDHNLLGIEVAGILGTPVPAVVVAAEGA